MPPKSRGVHFVRRNFDESAILAVAAKLAFESDPDFSESELATISAMQRAHPAAGQNQEELGEWLANMDESQIEGVVNNTKGVLHEMEFVRLENEDGDNIHAALFGSTNNPGFDVQFVDVSSGEVWETQLKASDSAAYVQDWVDAHPDGEILVTEELAAKMDLPSSGISNEEITARTSEVVDQLVGLSENDDLWDYFPALTAASIALVAWELFQRYRRQEITLGRLKWMLAKTTGLKAGKLALLTAAMMTPGLNVVTGAALVVALLYSGANLLKGGARSPSPKRT
jgi:hypothetical protein